MGNRRAVVLATGFVALVAFLPFARPMLAGEAFFFRDLSRQFFPLRRFAVEGLRSGELRYWNPFLHEGEPLHILPVGYPLDLLQVLQPDEAGLSLSLALHVPLAALAFAALARSLGCGWIPAAGGALVYALGGFALSSLNLYVYAQAVAWAPLVMLGLRRAARDGGRWIVAASFATAAAASTLGAEVVLQAVVLGMVLAPPPAGLRMAGRVAAALLLGAGLAAPVLMPVASLVSDSARGAGLPVDVVVAHSVHPLTLPQIVIAAWHGNPTDIVNQWWGANFFPQGFPYVLSLYLGASALTLACAAPKGYDGPGLRLTVCLVVGLLLCVGRWIGLAPLVEALPALRAFRFPVKAFFTVHACVALLLALGLERLAGAREASGWRLVAGLGALGGALLTALQAAPRLAPDTIRWFLRGFLPPSFSWPERWATGNAIAADAAVGGLAAVVIAGLAVLVLARRLSPRLAVAGIAAVTVGDVLRAGAGLNPTVTRSFYRLSPEMQAISEQLRTGRTFTCDPESSGAYFRARRFHRAHDVWTFAVSRESLTPAYNVPFAVPTALSRDLTMLVPEWRVAMPDELERDIGGNLGRLREAGVAHVLCPQQLTNDALAVRNLARPASIAPFALYVYDVADVPPLRAVAREVRRAESREAAEGLAREGLTARGGAAVEGVVAGSSAVEGRVLAHAERADRITVEATASGPTVLVVRDAWAPGWEARVNGVAAPVLRANGRHRAVPIGAGHNRVELRYHPPGLRLGLLLATGSLLGTALLWTRSPRARGNGAFPMSACRE
jgi:hypothetical protein